MVLGASHWSVLLQSPFLDPVSQGAKHPFYEQDPRQQVFEFPPCLLLGGERLLTLTGPKIFLLSVCCCRAYFVA